MSNLHTEALQFLAPGVAHDLGNAVFALQGQVFLLPEGSVRAAFMECVQRLSAAAGSLRGALGDGSVLPLPAVMQQLHAAGRVPMRDLGLQLEVAAGQHQEAVPLVIIGQVLPLAALILRHLGERATTYGLRGTIAIHSAAAPEQAAGCVELQFRWLPEPGTLPFALGFAQLRERLQPVLQPPVVLAELAPDCLSLRVVRAPVEDSFSSS